jgi:hypothetical protein
MMCKCHSIFGSYQNIAQFLNKNKMDLLTLYNTKYYIRYLITIVLTSFNLTTKKIHVGILCFLTLSINPYNYTIRMICVITCVMDLCNMFHDAKLSLSIGTKIIPFINGVIIN